MPPYLTRKHNTYYFRQSVPPELRLLIGKREIKKSLGQDFPAAVRECKRFAIVADEMIAEARAQLDALPAEPFSREGIRRTQRVPLSKITPELETQYANLVRASLLETDLNKRIEGMDNDEFREYGEHIQTGIACLRRQLAMGQLEPMLESARFFLVGRGYIPDFTDADWRKLAYIVTQASLEAYQAMQQRQEGGIVPENNENVLPSQFVLQNEAPNGPARREEAPLSWEMLYDFWDQECPRPEATRNSYRAAMKLFSEFSGKTPQQVSRDDALSFRDFLREVKGNGPATTANKLGFIGCLYNAARDKPGVSKLLPLNPFANIRVKRPQRGAADEKRLPFSDAELKKIFQSRIYTRGERPRGGAGEASAWIPAIAYLTGMRLEEIGLLTKEQFQMDAKGNYYIHVLGAKTENSANRDVPLHPELIRAGLLDYVHSRKGRLFPLIRSTCESQTKPFSKWYGREMDKLGITQKSKVFHSFRHLFKDLCRNAGLEEAVIDQICGHEPGTVGGRYGKGRRVDVLAELLRKVEVPVPLPIIKAR